MLGDKLSEKDGQAEIVLKLTEQNQLKTADLQENIRDSIRQYFGDLRRQLEAKEQLFHEQLDKAADQCWQIDDQHRNRLIKFRKEVRIFFVLKFKFLKSLPSTLYHFSITDILNCFSEVPITTVTNGPHISFIVCHSDD